MPVPCGFVVKNATKMRSVSSTGSPIPEQALAAERFEREEQLVRRGGKSRIRVPPPAAAIARHVPRYWSAAARRPLQAQG